MDKKVTTILTSDKRVQKIDKAALQGGIQITQGF